MRDATVTRIVKTEADLLQDSLRETTMQWKWRQTELCTLRMIHCLLPCAVLSLVSPSNAFEGKAVISAIARSRLTYQDSNVTIPTKFSYGNIDEDLIKGVKVIQSMKAASSCKTKATRQLLTSCSLLDDAQRSQGMSVEELDRVKSQYAARLAVCELQEAADPPKLQRCSSVGRSELAWPVDRSQLSLCLKELQSNAAFWGSYSNNLQNVGYMCQVAHAEIEKDELTEQRRASLETTLSVTKALSEFQQSVTTQNAELFSYAQNVRDLHRQTVEELLAARKDSSTIMHELREGFASELQNVAAKAEDFVKTVSADAAGTNEEVLRYVQNVQHGLEHIWQMMAEENAELAARQFQDATTNHDLAVATQQKLENIMLDDIGRLSDGLYGLSGSLLSASDQVTSMREEHVSLAKSLDRSLAKTFHLAQTLEELNMPILEMFAALASFGRFILADECLILIGFFSPIAVLLFLAAIFQIRFMFWLSKLGLLLITSYAVSRLYMFRDSSPVLQGIYTGAWQAATTSLALVSIYNISSVAIGAAQQANRQRYPKSRLDSSMQDEEELARLREARKTSIENASMARFQRASTSPPC